MKGTFAGIMSQFTTVTEPQYYATYGEANADRKALMEAYPGDRWEFHVSADYRYPNGFIIKVRDTDTGDCAILSNGHPVNGLAPGKGKPVAVKS